MTNIRKGIALLLLAASLVFPTGAFAAQTAPSSETLDIPAEYTLTGVPSSISTYTRVDNGQPPAFSTTDVPVRYRFASNIVWNSSFGAGTKLTLAATSLTGGVGAVPTIASSARQFSIDLGANNTGATFLASLTSYSGSAITLGTTTAATNGTIGASNLTSLITIPANAVGTYAGSLTFSVVYP